MVIFNNTVPVLSMSASPLVLGPSSSVGSQRTHTTVGGQRSPRCGLSFHGRGVNGRDCLGSRVIGTSYCRVPATSEKVGDTISPRCDLSSHGEFKQNRGGGGGEG